MDFVTGNIAIGNAAEASDLPLLERHGVTGVLNVAWDVNIAHDRTHPHSRRVEYEKVGLFDGTDNHPASVVAAALTLARMLERHERVLIHCFAGVNRSPTVACVYLTAKRNVPYYEVVEEIRQKRRNADPYGSLALQALALNEWREWI